MTEVPCQHLEALIAEPPSQSVNTHPVKDIDRFYYDSGAGFVIPQNIKDGSFEAGFRGKLRRAGLSVIEVDILVNRFVYDMSIRDICKELKIVSSTVVFRLLSEAMSTIKKKGLK